MRVNYPLAIVLSLLPTLPMAVEAIGQGGKRVIDQQAPVINDKEVKVECVFSIPHMILRNKVKETAVFTVTSDARITNTDCPKSGSGYRLEPGKDCKVLFNTEDVGKNITLVSAETQSTRYAFRGNWPIYACCRGKFTNKELDESKGPHSKEGMSELIIAGNNKSIKTGVFYRAYAVNILPDRIDNHNREKDGNNMFNLGNFNWGSRQFQKGPCDDR